MEAFSCLLCCTRGLKESKVVRRRSLVNRKWYHLCLKCFETLDEAERKDIIHREKNRVMGAWR